MGFGGHIGGRRVPGGEPTEGLTLGVGVASAETLAPVVGVAAGSRVSEQAVLTSSAPLSVTAIRARRIETFCRFGGCFRS